MTEETGKMKEILCRFLDEINRLFRHEIMFENLISGRHCFSVSLMRPSAAFLGDFQILSNIFLQLCAYEWLEKTVETQIRGESKII